MSEWSNDRALRGTQNFSSCLHSNYVEMTNLIDDNEDENPLCVLSLVLRESRDEFLISVIALRLLRYHYRQSFEINLLIILHCDMNRLSAVIIRWSSLMLSFFDYSPSMGIFPLSL